MTGEKPPVAADRVLDDGFDWLSYRSIAGFGDNFKQAVDWALRIRPEERPQSVAQFRSQLGSISGAAVSKIAEKANVQLQRPVLPEPPSQAPVPQPSAQQVAQTSRPKWLILAIAAAVIALFAVSVGAFLVVNQMAKQSIVIRGAGVDPSAPPEPPPTAAAMATNPEPTSTPAQEALSIPQEKKPPTIDSDGPSVETPGDKFTGVTMPDPVAVGDKTKVSEADARQWYDENKKEFEHPELVRASHILIRVPKGADEKTVAEKKTLAQAALVRVTQNGEDFATVAKEVSEEPDAKQSGGDLKFFPKDRMVPEFANAAFAMKKGDVSNAPVLTTFGWHVIKVTDRKQAGIMPFDEVKDQVTSYLEGIKRGE
jgi:hypothetical protein